MNIIPSSLLQNVPAGSSFAGIRPEHLSISDDSRLTGKVVLVESLGNETLVHLSLGDQSAEPLIIRSYQRTTLKLGDTVGVNWSDDIVHYFDNDGKVLHLA